MQRDRDTRSRAAVGLRRWLAAAVVGLLGVPTAALAQSATDYANQAETLRGRLDRLEEVYLQPVVLDDPMTMATRLADGQMRYMVGEYDAAAIILMGIVESDTYRGLPGYDDARFFLAESLFQLRNYVMARGYYEEIVEHRGDPHAMEAASRLLEVAFEMDRYDGLDEVYNSLQATGGASGPEVAYVRAKAMYFQGAYDRALATFGGIAQGNDVHVRARYFMGAIHARQGDFDSAIAAFEDVQAEALTMSDPWAIELAELARLGRGRVYYEQERWDEATLAYAEVDRESEHFERALYEISWTLIREDRYADAIRNLEILRTIADRENVVAEANLLRGDLLMRLGRYAEAVTLFEGVYDLYEPVETDLREMLEGRRTPEEFFDALVDPRTGALRLPEVATQWVDEDIIVQRSIELSYDVAVLSDAIEESRMIIEELEIALSDDSGVDVFPALREGWGNALELENAVTGLRSDIVEYERRLLWSSMSSDQRAQYESLAERREQAGERFEALPQTFEALAERQRQTLAELEEMTLEIYRQEQEIALQRTQIESMRALMEDQVRQGERTQPELDRMERQFAEIEADLDRQERGATALRREVERSQAGVGLSDGDAGPNSQVRGAYMEAIAAEHAYLVSLRGGGSGDFGTLDRALDTLDQVDTGLEQAYVELGRLAASETEQYTAILNDERAALRGYERLLEGYRAQSSNLTGEVTYAAFLDVQSELSGITLRANLGIIDVAWRQKEEVTEEISDLFEARNRSLRILDADFAELLLDE